MTPAPSTKLAAACSWLLLELMRGHSTVEHVQRAAAQAGIAPATLRRALAALGVRAHQVFVFPVAPTAPADEHRMLNRKPGAAEVDDRAQWISQEQVFDHMDEIRSRWQLHPDVPPRCHLHDNVDEPGRARCVVCIEARWMKSAIEAALCSQSQRDTRLIACRPSRTPPR